MFRQKSCIYFFVGMDEPFHILSEYIRFNIYRITNVFKSERRFPGRMGNNVNIKPVFFTPVYREAYTVYRYWALLYNPISMPQVQMSDTELLTLVRYQTTGQWLYILNRINKIVNNDWLLVWFGFTANDLKF